MTRSVLIVARRERQNTLLEVGDLLRVSRRDVRNCCLAIRACGRLEIASISSVVRSHLSAAPTCRLRTSRADSCFANIGLAWAVSWGYARYPRPRAIRSTARV